MKQLFNTDVFSRYGGSTISERTFMGSIAGFISYGLVLTYIMASFFAPAMPSMWFLIGVGLVIILAGPFAKIAAYAAIGWGAVTLLKGEK